MTGPVPKPTIEVQLVNGESCDLTCDGDTTDAEPVTYSWAKDNEMLLDTFREITRKVFVNLCLTSAYQSVKFCILSSNKYNGAEDNIYK